MTLTHAQIKAAADGIDAIAQIEVLPVRADRLGGQCVGVAVESARDLVTFGMSLAHGLAVSAGEEDGSTLTNPPADAIDDAISSWGRPRVDSLGGGRVVAYWPAVAVDPEVTS